MSKIEEVKLMSRLVSLVFELGAMHAANAEAVAKGEEPPYAADEIEKTSLAVRGVTAAM